MIEPRSTGSDAKQLLVGLSWLSAAAVGLTFCINVGFVEDRVALWVENQLDTSQRRTFVVSMLVSAVLPWLAALLARRTTTLSALARGAWVWGHRVSPAVLLVPIVPLLDRGSFVEHPVTSLSYILLIGLSAAAIGTRCLEEGFAADRLRAPARTAWLDRIPSALVAAVCIALFVHFAHYSVLRHHQMRSDAYDLAIFDNMMWHLTHGEWFRSTPAFGADGNHLHRHTTFGAILLVPFYAIWPRAETLLTLQAAFVASTPIPIYLLGRRLLESSWTGFALALSYALYAPTHGGTFYDFHFLTMAAPLFAWVFFLLFTEHNKSLIAMTALTLGWREDTGAVLAFTGIVVWLFGVYPRRTLFFVGASALYFVVVKFVLMPLGGSHASFSDYYGRLKAPGSPGFWSIIETLLTNPAYVFDEVFDKKRLLYILNLFVPLLFFPLRNRITWIALIPAAGFTLLSSRDPLYRISFQYVAYWAPPAFLGLFLVLRRRFLENDRPRALTANAAAIVLATLLSSFLFGSFSQSPSMRAGFIRMVYDWTEEDATRLATFRELVAQVPSDASIALTSNEVPHVSNRRNAYGLAIGYFDADYILVRRNKVGRRSGQHPAYARAIASGEYTQVANRGPFLLWKRTEDGAE